jgi:hypothetical protein
MFQEGFTCSLFGKYERGKLLGKYIPRADAVPGFGSEFVFGVGGWCFLPKLTLFQVAIFIVLIKNDSPLTLPGNTEVFQ